MSPVFMRDFRPTLLWKIFVSLFLIQRDYHTLWFVVPNKLELKNRRKLQYSLYYISDLFLNGFSLNSTDFNRLY